MVTLVIGTGVKDVTKELLQNDIAAAEKMLAGCTITDQSNPQIYYPDFWITTRTEKTFKDAIEFAIAIYQKANATPEEIETAITDLAIAVKVFENAKIIGPRRWSDDDYSGSDSSSGVSSAVTVSAVKAGNGKIHPILSFKNAALIHRAASGLFRTKAMKQNIFMSMVKGLRAVICLRYPMWNVTQPYQLFSAEPRHLPTLPPKTGFMSA